MIGETKPAGEPSFMPVDRDRWFRELHLSNFVNTYYQYRDLQSLGNCSRVLIVGPRRGLDTQVLRWRGYDVTTFDIDETFQPDFTGSIHDLSRFREREFDAVIVSNVLEHLPERYLDRALHELARVAYYALIYLPIHGKHFHLRLTPGIKDIDVSLIADIPLNPFERPDGKTIEIYGRAALLGDRNERLPNQGNEKTDCSLLQSDLRLSQQGLDLKPELCAAVDDAYKRQRKSRLQE